MDMKRLTAIAIALTSLCGCKMRGPNDDPETRKVLMIGNSFSVCVLKHLPAICQDRNEPLDIGSLYIGGCSLKRHWENVLKDENEDFKPYRYDRVVRGKRYVDGARRNICDVLRETKWDIVTIQQASHDSWRPETYHPYGDNLVAKIRELAPQARIVLQETWSYTPWDKRLKKWHIDQNEMYAKLHAAYSDFAKQHKLDVIRFGTAVQEWRKRHPVVYTEHSFGGDVVGGGNQEEKDCFKRDVNNEWVPNSDVFHLGRRGEYFQALVWAAKLMDIDPVGVEIRPDYVTEQDADLMKEIAAEFK